MKIQNSKQSGIKLVSTLTIALVLNTYALAPMAFSAENSPAATPYEQILLDLKKTHQLFDDGRYEEAVLNYTDIIQRGLTGAGIYFGLAQSYRLLGLYQNAIKYFDLAIQISPSFSDAYFELARTYEALGDLKDAEVNYRNALDKGTPSDITFANYGFFKLSLNPPQITAAQNLVDAGYANYPDNPHIKYLHANILFKTGQYEAAWAEIEHLRLRDYDGIESNFILELSRVMEDPYHQISTKRRIRRLEERQNLFLMTQSINAAQKTYSTQESNQ